VKKLTGQDQPKDKESFMDWIKRRKKERSPATDESLEEVDTYVGAPVPSGDEEEFQADDAFMDDELVEEDSAHSKLIDTIAAKVAERLLAEAKKTNKQ
jgi:hypothetical protein